jgi:hypothetical protein
MKKSTPLIISKVDYEDFIAYGPSRNCIYLPTCTPWPNATIDEWLPWKPKLDALGKPMLDKKGKVIKIPPYTWLVQNRRAAAMTWAPGEPQFIHDRLPVETGWVTKAGAATFNTYRAPVIKPGNPKGAQRWIDHWYAIYSAVEADHCIAYLAHLVQRPAVKINHCAVMIGAPKIGKDTLLEPMETAVGSGNFKEITLTNLISKNNEFLRGVFVRLSEARDMGEQGRIDRYGLYDHTKNMLVTPPNMLRINEKYIREYYIVNCFGMVITSNHRDALYLPPDDRRYFIAVSECKTDAFTPDYWKAFWNYYNHENGIADVIALLRERDLSKFDPKAPPLKTPGFWHVVNADHSPIEAELGDAIDALSKPEALTIDDLVTKAPGADWLTDRKMSRAIPHRLERCGYLRTPNPDSESNGGMWLVGEKDKKKRKMIYARDDLSPEERLIAARALQARLNKDKPSVVAGTAHDKTNPSSAT